MFVGVWTIFPKLTYDDIPFFTKIIQAQVQIAILWSFILKSFSSPKTVSFLVNHVPVYEQMLCPDSYAKKAKLANNYK